MSAVATISTSARRLGSINKVLLPTVALTPRQGRPILNGRCGSVERAETIASGGKTRRCRGNAAKSEGAAQTARTNSQSSHN